MTEAEFHRFLEKVSGAMPLVWQWLEGLPDPKATMLSWKEALEDCDFEDCIDAVRCMVRGDLQMPSGYERERIPGVIRTHCKKLRSERRRSQEGHALAEAATQRGKSQPVGPWIRRAMEIGSQLRDGSLSQEAHDAELKEILRKLGSDPNASEPRFFCPDCLDQTRVCIWHPDEVTKARRSGKPPRRIAASIACKCNNQPDCGPKYNQEIHFKIRHSVPSRQETVALMEWIDATEPQRFHEFDEWS